MVSQGGYQIAAGLVTLAIAISVGSLTGEVLNIDLFDNIKMPFHDKENFICEEHEHEN